MLVYECGLDQGEDNQCLATYQDWLSDITWNHVIAFQSKLFDLNAWVSQISTWDKTKSYSLCELQAEAISLLMNVLQSRVSLAEEYWYDTDPSIGTNFQLGCGGSVLKVAKDLSSKVKLLEDFIQSRTGGLDTIQERGVFEAPLTVGSEISKVDEQAFGKVGLPLVPSAAQMRSLRKGSNDQLAITIDSESDCLLDKGASVEDKGHMFKSLNTSGLVPVQGKMIADRLDGIWYCVFEAPSLTAGSEISEVDEQACVVNIAPISFCLVPVGKVGLPLVPSAAQMRSLRKGSNDQLAITIDSESDRLLDKGATVEDKGHMFKSLNTSGLVPVQGKMIADRLNGIWVSGGQVLMRQPRARRGVIAYWLTYGFLALFCDHKQCIKMATIGLKVAASVSCEPVSSFLGKERIAPLRHSSSKRPQFVPNVLKCAPAGKWTRDWLFSDKVKGFELVVVSSHACLAAVAFLCLSHNLRKYGVRKFLFVDQYHGHVQSFSKDYVLKFDEAKRALVIWFLPCLILKIAREVVRMMFPRLHKLWGVILCLNAAAKISHGAQGIAALASRWHALASCGPDDRRQSFQVEVCKFGSGRGRVGNGPGINPVRPRTYKVAFINGDFAVSSIAQFMWVILCLNAAAKITHKAQGIAASRGLDDRSHMRFSHSNRNLEAASSLVRSVSSESDMEAMNYVPLPTNAQLTSYLASYHRRQSFQYEPSRKNGTVDDVKKIVAILDAGDIPSTDVVEVVVSPPFVFLTSVKSELRSEIQVAAQNCWVKKGGAFTGEVSAEMLANLGFVGDRVAYALSQGLKVIACVGETLEQREAGTTMEAVAAQTQAIAGIAFITFIAYFHHYVVVHAGLRKWFAEKVSADVSASTRIIYGGSVIGSNCKSTVEVESAKHTWDQLAGPSQSTCAQVIHARPDKVNTIEHNAGEDDNMDGIAMGKDLEIGVPRNSDKVIELNTNEVAEPETANNVMIAKTNGGY
ncbi:triosephosphate isomerase, cytosolic [Tanacetum coccineum]